MSRENEAEESVGSLSRRLPIHRYRAELVEAVKSSRCVVVTGETGCGKTTQLPQFLREAGFASEDSAIAVTQPRRVAAISVARRVAEEAGVELGREVGYQVRFDDCSSSLTAIKYMTDGCLLRELLDDPELSRYGVVVLDEAHERSLATDILFGLVKTLLGKPLSETKSRKRELKVVIMSATLNSQQFSTFFNSCPVFEIPGRTFPVSLHYCCPDDSFDGKKLIYMGQMARVVMEIHLDHPEGDILTFLTGQGEIETMCNRLFKMAEEIDYDHDVSCQEICGLKILPLYGAMSTEQQQSVFSSREPGIRRVIVATNIATTSLTVDGVVYVVDCGYVKQLTYNPQTGLDALSIVPIAKSEATQRAGRAGRTCPGKCFRLYSSKFFESLEEETVPEIKRTSLTGVVLSLKCMGIVNVVEFQYLDPPDEKMVLEALRQLFYYRAIDADGHVTELGRQLVQFPLLPSLARVVLQSRKLSCEEVILPIVAMLSVESVFIRPSSTKEAEKALQKHNSLAQVSGGNSDFSTLFTVYQLATGSDNIRRWCREHYVHWRAINTAQRIHQQLQSLLDRQPDDGDPDTDKTLSSPLSQRIRQSLCYGLFGSVARLSPGQRSFRTMDGHSTICYIHPSSAVFGQEEKLDWVVFYELVDTAKTYMRTLCPIRYAWIKDLLPQLHDIDVYRLSNCERKREVAEVVAREDLTPATKKVCQSPRETLKERASSARERFLARKNFGK